MKSNALSIQSIINININRFNLKAAHQGEQACITIPELDRSEHSLSGFHDHCNDLPNVGLFSPLAPAIY